MRFATLGLAVTVLTWAAIASAHGLVAHPARHLILYVGAGALWLLATRLARPSKYDRVIVLVLAVAMRVPAWLTPPIHSDDVYRYFWDARVQRAGINPYLYPPDAPELTHLRDENWTHVNNRDLRTIYPPLAQLFFRLPWKPVVAAADLGVCLLLTVWLGPVKAIAWAWCPLAVIELGMDAHVDALGILLMMAAFAVGKRRGWAGALLGASAAVKLVTVAALPGLRSRRAVVTFVGAALLVSLPYLGAGRRIFGSLPDYGRRWRGNDGAFALIYEVTHAAVEHTRYRGRVEEKGSWLFPLVTGRDNDTVFPDEMANFVARAIAGILLLIAMTLAFVARAGPIRFAEVALGGWLLLAPTLHPWYALWAVPLVAAGGNFCWLVLAALVPLGYVPLADWLRGGPWHDPVWTRLVEHGLTWGVLLLGLIPAKRSLLSSDQ